LVLGSSLGGPTSKANPHQQWWGFFLLSFSLGEVILDVAKLPVLEILSAMHFVADVTLGMGEVVYDYMKD
jgi:acetoacetate decarboxylase